MKFVGFFGVFLDFFLYLHWVSGIMDVYSLAMFSAKNMRV